MSDYPRQLRDFGSYNVMCEAADHIELIEARLAEAEALLRESQPFMGREVATVREQIRVLTPLGNRIDAFLSKTTQDVEQSDSASVEGKK